jgi:hypothetical protein
MARVSSDRKESDQAGRWTDIAGLGCDSGDSGRKIKLPNLNDPSSFKRRVKKPKLAAKAESAVASSVTVDEKERKQEVEKAQAGSTMKIEVGDTKSVQKDGVEHKGSAESATV